MSSRDYVYYEFSPQVLDQLGLPSLSFPVRKEQVWRIFQGRHVEFPLLLDELDQFITDDPEAGESYRTIFAVLSYILAIRAGAAGDARGANRLLGLALKHRPDNISLRANHALSLHMLGRHAEAIAEYHSLLSEPRMSGDPLIRMLAARALGDSGDAEAAYLQLLDCPAALSKDEAFRRLISRYREQAGFGPVDWVAPTESQAGGPSPSISGRPSAGQVESSSRPGACGAEVVPATASHLSRGAERPDARHAAAETASPGDRYCRGCGKALRKGVRFCPGCGRAVRA